MKLKRSKDRRVSLTKAHHFVTGEVGEWDSMDGYTFNGDYVGYSTLSKPATGVGILQQPIKDQYLRARKQGNSKKVILRLVQSGLAISLVDTGGGQKGEMFYDMNSISYIECLRFAILSGNDKKVRAMFVPLADKNLPSVKDKNAFTVDKNFHFLTQINHPPLLACVLRRPKGIKALDCHIFMLESPDDAFRIVSIIHQIQERGSNPDLMTEFKQNDNNSFKRGQNSDVIRTEYGEYSVYRGQKQYELKDDYFRQPEQEMGRDGQYRDNDENYGWSYERGREPPGEDNWRSYDNDRDQYERHDERYPVQMRGGSQNRGDYSPYDQGGREFVNHGRQRSSDSGEGRMNMSFSDSSDRGGRYDDHSDRRSFGERDRGNISPRSSHAPPKVAEKPNKPDPMLRMGPPSPGHHSPTQPLSPRGDPRSPSFQPPQVYTQPPAGRGYPPPSPTGGYSNPPPQRGGYPPSPTSPGFSMSNLESRQTADPKPEEDQQPKPVAKVPPHMFAGVKVLPTGFQPGAVKLKPKTAKHDKSYGSEDSDPDYDNNVNIKRKMKEANDYGYHSEKYTDDRNKYNYSSDQGHGDGYGKPGNNYYGGADQNKGSMYDSGYGKDAPQHRSYGYTPDQQYRQHGEENRQYIESYDDGYGVQRRGSDQRQPDRGGSNRYSVPSSVYDDRSRDPGNRWSGSSGGQSRSHSNYDMSGRAPSGESGHQGKEAEIASMFTNFHVKGEATPYSTSGTDFEQSLGYFP